ncbi:DUF2007 domain-containing protein [Flavobacterium sp. MK4S-17]|uniref:putative signal transducing protein n=1 Tax=Flavobacterium sp. MK4S-17 TaxID=2543737 RepID=UPI00135763B7|nr:DUF2007 domain-containing protein [Flavobacterium sp. MK4S-17]
MIKVFSGSGIMALAVQSELEAAGIDVIVKNNIESGIIVGLTPIGQAVEIYVDGEDVAKAKEIIENWKIRTDK